MVGSKIKRIRKHLKECTHYNKKQDNGVVIDQGSENAIFPSNNDNASTSNASTANVSSFTDNTEEENTELECKYCLIVFYCLDNTVYLLSKFLYCLKATTKNSLLPKRC